MKTGVLSVAAIGLVLASLADAQSLPPPSEGPSPREAPRTQRERDLGLAGKPEGQRERSAPDEDGYTTEEPDDDDDLGEALRSAESSKPQSSKPQPSQPQPR